MKKLLPIILCCLFAVFCLSSLWGIVSAQEDDPQPQPDPQPQQQDKLAEQWNSTYQDSEIWINFWNNCLTGMWRWCFDYEKIIWINKMQNQRITTTTIAQDVILAATYMVWTVLTIVLIYCWIWYILASRSGKKPDLYKKWLIDAMIWAVLVRWAYAIVRLIQYIAKW